MIKPTTALPFICVCQRSTRRNRLNQERELREVAPRMGCDIVKVYRDHGVSGAKGQRPTPPRCDLSAGVDARPDDREPGARAPGGRLPNGMRDSQGLS